MLKHVRRGAALILSMAMFIQLGIGNNYITFANEESQTPEQTQEESGTTAPKTTGEVPEESNDDSTGTQESTEPAPETGNNEGTVPDNVAASTLVVQFVNEDKTNIDVNQYPDKEIALTGLYVNNPYQLVFNDHQINTEIEGYTLSKIVDANDAQKEYPLTTMEQGYVDITLSQNITKLQLVYTKNPEPVQQPDNSQTETDSQQPSDEQEESSEEDGQQEEQIKEDTETVKEETESEEVSMPEQVLSAVASDGATITIMAPEGSVPENSTVIAEPVENDSIAQSIEDVLNEEDKTLNEYKAYDITILDKDGNEIQPEKDVQVSITGVSVSGEEKVVFHIDDSNKVEKVSDTSVGQTTLFNAESFSIYVLSGVNNGISTLSIEGDRNLKVGDTAILECDWGWPHNHNWRSSDNDIVTIVNKKGNQATIKAISKGTARIYCGINYINITVTSDQLTVKFNLNGGNGNVPSNIIAKEGDVITLPSGEGLTYSSYYGDKVFVGWSEIKNPNAEGNYKPGKGGTIYPSGSEYYVSKDVTLYAAWADKNVDAEFYIRLDGIIPTEPQGHDASEYSSAINITDAIKVGTFYTNSTYPGVLPQLNSTPSDWQIKRVYPEYNPETQYVLWYVIKKESTWHVDGVLLDKNKVNLAYDPNAPAGTWENMPDGRQYTQGEVAIISDKVPTRNGYTFVGWNTSKDGSGVPYKAQDRIQMNEDVTLYAQWIEKNKITINYAVIGNGGIVNRTSESLNPETGEAQGSTAEANKGYRFVGWYNNEACEGEPLTEDVYYKPNRPESGWINGTTFYAKFEPIEAEYKVEYYYQENGQYPEQATSSVTRKGTTDQKVEVTDEDKTPTKAGYVFDDKNENNVLADETLNGDGGTVLKVYFKQQFTVTYAPGDHGTFEPQTTGSLDYGTKTPEFKGETTGAAGYTFTGWDKDIADTVTGNVTYTAQWEANKDTEYKVEYYYQENGQYPEQAT
ncbi:InlB B-repeat-containing protein, partial [Faecalicoccus pleomorphus]|uniref:InlB B-repeat-containing protein n=1 Tax=Faecalicoccus pleomorphus TaxID=1323 RepID=UPI0029420F5D